MDAVADRAAVIEGLRVTAFPPPKVDPPLFWLAYPDPWEFDRAYARGLERMTLMGVLVVGGLYGRQVRADVSMFVGDLKPALETGEPDETISDLWVSQVEFEPVSIAGAEHLAALFTMMIVGGGS
jgi:hypothetical protein